MYYEYSLLMYIQYEIWEFTTPTFLVTPLLSYFFGMWTLGKKCLFYGFVLSIKGCWATSTNTTIFMLLLYYIMLYYIIKGCQKRPSRHSGRPSNIGETLGESCNIGKMLMTSRNNFFLGDKGGYEDGKGQCGCQAKLKGTLGNIEQCWKNYVWHQFFSKVIRMPRKCQRTMGALGKEWTTSRKHLTTLGKC